MKEDPYQSINRTTRHKATLGIRQREERALLNRISGRPVPVLAVNPKTGIVAFHYPSTMWIEVQMLEYLNETSQLMYGNDLEYKDN